MQKARSRLAAATVSQAAQPVTPAVRDLPHHTPTHGHEIQRDRKKSSPAFLNKYLKHMPLLVPAIGAYALLWHLIHQFYPAQLANVVLPGSFIPIILPFFVGTFFLLSYVLLNTKLSLVATLIITMGLFLRLHCVLL